MICVGIDVAKDKSSRYRATSGLSPYRTCAHRAHSINFARRPCQSAARPKALLIMENSRNRQKTKRRAARRFSVSKNLFGTPAGYPEYE